MDCLSKNALNRMGEISNHDVFYSKFRVFLHKNVATMFDIVYLAVAEFLPVPWTSHQIGVRTHLDGFFAVICCTLGVKYI